MQCHIYNIAGVTCILAKGRIMGISVYYITRSKNKSEAINKLFRLIDEDIKEEQIRKEEKENIPGYFNHNLEEIRN